VASAAAGAGADAAEERARDSLRLASADSVARARTDSLRRARADSIRAARDPRLVRAAALRDPGLRVLVSLDARRLFVLDGPDTLRVIPVGIGMDSTLVYQGRVWNFRTPRGIKRVLAKTAEPVWTPPEWHYVEVARSRGLRLGRLRRDRPVRVGDSVQLVVRDSGVYLARTDAPERPFAADEEVIWDSTLFIPPVGTTQRRVTGELGRYRLDLGDGYLIHGTPHAESVGERSSHGCMRLGDDDLEWLYARVPVGTTVYTY
jgi:hypothetical protein